MKTKSSNKQSYTKDSVQSKASVNKHSKGFYITLWAVAICLVFGSVYAVATTVISDSQINFGAGPNNRDLIGPTQEYILNVPSVYPTIQSALNTIPLYVQHPYTINISTGVYNENLIIPPFISSSANNITSESDRGKVTIVGNRFIPTNVLVKSIFVEGPHGYGAPLFIEGLTTYGQQTIDSNENSTIGIYGGGQVTLAYININTTVYAANGIVCYDSKCELHRVNFSTGLTQNGVVVKKNSIVSEQKLPAVNTSVSGNTNEWATAGSVGKYVYQVQEGIVFAKQQSISTGVQGKYSNFAGFIMEFSNDTLAGMIYGVNRINDSLKIDGGIKTNTALNIFREANPSQLINITLDASSNYISSTSPSGAKKLRIRNVQDEIAFDVNSTSDIIRLRANGNISLIGLTGAGNALVCVDPNGILYRGNATGCP